MSQIVVYARVSTDDQDLDHQKENLWDYATNQLGYDADEIDVLAETSSGANTDRSAYRELLRRVREGEADAVVCREVTRLGRTMREISENAHEMVDDHGVGLYVSNDDIEIDPGGELSMRDKMLLNVLAWAAELELKKLRENTIAGLKAAREAGKWTNRPPYGFTTDDDGYLQPNDDFGKALEVIHAVEDLGWSHRKASQHSGVPRRTIPNILDRKSLYMEESNE